MSANVSKNEKNMSAEILKYKSPKGHYRADVCIVWCFDARFGKLFKRFVSTRKFRHYDVIAVGGGAKSFTDTGDKIGREFLLRQVETSAKLHHPPLVVLMTHSDCGAYGGLRAFGDDQAVERKRHEGYLRAAKNFLCRKLPRSVKIETVFADFNGLHSV